MLPYGLQPSATVAIKVERSLMYDIAAPIHRRVLTLYLDEVEFFNLVARLAMPLAEHGLYVPVDVLKQTDWLVGMVNSFKCDRFGNYDYGGPSTEFTHTLELNKEHLFSCARALAGVLPKCFWGKLHCAMHQRDWILFVGNAHRDEYP